MDNVGQAPQLSADGNVVYDPALSAGAEAPFSQGLPPAGVYFDNNSSTSGNDSDEENIRQRARALLDGRDFKLEAAKYLESTTKGGNESDTDCADDFSYGIDGTADGLISPTFNKHGKFVGYEERQQVVQDPNRTIHDILFNGTPDDLKYAVRHNKRCKGCLGGIGLVLLAITIMLSFFLIGDEIGYALGPNSSSSQQQQEGSSNSNIPEEVYGSTATDQDDQYGSTPNQDDYIGEEEVGTGKEAEDPTTTVSANGDVPESAHYDNPNNHPHYPNPNSHPRAPTTAMKHVNPTAAIATPPVSTPTDAPEELPERTVTVDPSALSTVVASEPYNKFAGLIELGVEADAKETYIRFDLSGHQPWVNQEIVEATLLLYLRSHGGTDGGTRIQVDLLPYADEWMDDTVTWNSPPNNDEAVTVNTFVWEESMTMADTQIHLIPVDVTAAITATFKDAEFDPSKQVTFKLSSESEGYINFAGQRWNYGEGVPELVIGYL
jgi:cytoskeletal protein RodZ